MTRGSGAQDSIFHSRAGARLSPADRLFRLAEDRRNSGDLARMRSLLKVYSGLAPARPELAAALALSGRYRDALSLSARLLRSGLTPEELVLLGNPWANIVSRPFARRALLEAKAAPPPRGAARLRAMHLFLLGHLSGTEACRPPLFRGRLSIMNTYAGQFMLERLQPRRALRLLSEAERNYPADEFTCGRLAEALISCGLEEKALGMMRRKAATIRSPGFSAWRGQLLLACGRRAEAAAVLSSTTALKSPMTACWLGAALLKLGKPAKAAAVLRAGLAKDPSDPETRLWLADALMQTGEPAAAQKVLAPALKEWRSNPWTLLTAACLAPGKDAKALLREFARGEGKLLRPPLNPGAAWARAALSASYCRRPEPHFLSLAGHNASRRLVSGKH